MKHKNFSKPKPLQILAESQKSRVASAEVLWLLDSFGKPPFKSWLGRKSLDLRPSPTGSFGLHLERF
jgi:hypothetical protein